MWDITEIVKEVWGNNWVNHIQLEASGDIVIMWDKREWDGEISSIGMYSVSYSFARKNQDFSWHLNAVYGPNDRHEGEEICGGGGVGAAKGCVKDLGYSVRILTQKDTPPRRRIVT